MRVSTAPDVTSFGVYRDFQIFKFHTLWYAFPPGLVRFDQERPWRWLRHPAVLVAHSQEAIESSIDEFDPAEYRAERVGEFEGYDLIRHGGRIYGVPRAGRGRSEHRGRAYPRLCCVREHCRRGNRPHQSVARSGARRILGLAPRVQAVWQLRGPPSVRSHRGAAARLQVRPHGPRDARRGRPAANLMADSRDRVRSGIVALDVRDDRMATRRSPHAGYALSVRSLRGYTGPQDRPRNARRCGSRTHGIS